MEGSWSVKRRGVSHLGFVSLSKSTAVVNPWPPVVVTLAYTVIKPKRPLTFSRFSPARSVISKGLLFTIFWRERERGIEMKGPNGVGFIS